MAAKTKRVRLRPRAKQFIRSVRDKDGNVLKTLKFIEGEVYELSGRELEAVEPAIGHALLEVVKDADGIERTADQLSRRKAASDLEKQAELLEKENAALRKKVASLQRDMDAVTSETPPASTDSISEAVQAASGK